MKDAQIGGSVQVYLWMNHCYVKDLRNGDLWCLSTSQSMKPLLQELASRARLFKEYKEVQREIAADSDIQLACDDSNIFKWTALIKGPSETPFKGGVFQLAFSVPEQYPLQPPQVWFLTKIFHPNVHFKAIFCALAIPGDTSLWQGRTLGLQLCQRRGDSTNDTIVTKKLFICVACNYCDKKLEGTSCNL
ncbi:unnamed protein product [Camellia sinensis]